MDELLVDFLTESAEHLEALEARWVRSGRDPSKSGILDELPRRLRAIGGALGLLDLPRSQRLAHAAGPLLERLRAGGPRDHAVVDLIPAVLDRLRNIVGAALLRRSEPAGDDSELIARIESAAASVSAPTERRAYLTVFARNEVFALPIAVARSGARIETLTRVPSAPPYLLGFANLGGAVVAVVCLARRLDPDAQLPATGMLAVVIASRGQTFALAVQDFGDVVEASEADIAPAPARATLSSHVLRTGSLSAPILDPELVFDPHPSGGRAPSPSPV